MGRYYGSGAVALGGVLAYLRHNYTNYHDLLAQLDGKIGTADAYLVVKRRVMQACEDALAWMTHREERYGTAANSMG